MMTRRLFWWLAASTVALVAAVEVISQLVLPRPFDSGGAYMQNVTPSAATIAVTTATANQLTATVFLERDSTGSKSVALVSDPRPLRLHDLRVTGLRPDTRYRYEVRNSEGALLSAAGFHTAPHSGVRSVRFVVFGDSGGVRESGSWLPSPLRQWLTRDWPREQAKVAQLIQDQLNADLVVHTGDVVYPYGERERYHEAFFEPLAPLIRGTPLYPTPGNHDYRTENAAPYLDAFHLPTNDQNGSERFYSFDYGDVHFISLDSRASELAVDGPQARWLERDLAATNATWRVVLMHVGPYTNGPHGPNKRARKAFTPAFERYGVQLVLSGHDHNYQRFHPIDGITYLISGAGGGNLYEVQSSEQTARVAMIHHVLVIDADDQRLSLRAVDLEGRTFDELTLSASD